MRSSASSAVLLVGARAPWRGRSPLATTAVWPPPRLSSAAPRPAAQLRLGLAPAVLFEHALPALAFSGERRVALDHLHLLAANAALAIELPLSLRLDVDVRPLALVVGLEARARLREESLEIGQRALLRHRRIATRRRRQGSHRDDSHGRSAVSARHDVHPSRALNADLGKPARASRLQCPFHGVLPAPRGHRRHPAAPGLARRRLCRVRAARGGRLRRAPSHRAPLHGG